MDSIHVTAVMSLYLHLFGKGICQKHAKYTWDWQNTLDRFKRVVGFFSDKCFQYYLSRIF